MYQGEWILTLLVPIIASILGLVAFYFIIKSAVKNGMIAAEIYIRDRWK